MTSQDTTHPALTAIAELLHHIRPDWDKPGILTHLDTARLRVGVTPATLAIAAIHAATNPTNRTPAVIPLDGEHWRNPAVTPHRNVAPPRRADWCPSHIGEYADNCRGCAADTKAAS
jgi:hypothetical protein